MRELRLTYQDRGDRPEDWIALHDLLRDMFGLDLSPLKTFDLFDPSYRPFSYLDETQCCVANAAAVSLPLVIRGQPVDAMGIQSVATRPEWRRRGLSRELIGRALAWCDSLSPLTFLMTAI